MAQKQPWLKLFTGDILGDEELKSCSLAARGFFLYLLSLMHRSVRRGYLCQANGQPWTLDQLARMTGCSTAEAAHLTQELLTSGVFSATDDGIVYSRRMVREADLSQKRSEAGRRGAAAANLPRQNERQNRGKRVGKPPGNALGSEDLVSSLGKEERNLSPPSEGGCRGEEGLPRQNARQTNEEFTDDELAALWVKRRGVCAARNEFDKVLQAITELKSVGVTARIIRDEIVRLDRLATADGPWDLVQRLAPTAKKRGPSEAEILARLEAKERIA